MSRRTLKLVALGYVVKTLILGVTWLLVPDLPQIVRAKAREAWTAVTD
jgi:hypothetical protein